MKERNEKKAKVLYDFLDSSRLFRRNGGERIPFSDDCSFVTGDKDMDAKFVKEAQAQAGKPEGSPHGGRHACQHL